MISVRIRSYSGPYFLAFGLNMVSLRIQSDCGKIRTRITPNTDTFYAVQFSLRNWLRPLLCKSLFSVVLFYSIVIRNAIIILLFYYCIIIYYLLLFIGISTGLRIYIFYLRQFSFKRYFTFCFL